MKLRGTIFAIASLALYAAGTTFAGPEIMSTGKESKAVQMEQAPACDPRWYFSLGGGADFDIGNSGFSHAFESSVPGFNLTFGPFLARQSSPKVQWDDAFDTTWHAGGEFGYALTDHLEVFVSGAYSHADSAGSVDWGAIKIFTFGPTFTLPLRAQWDDYDAFGGELGFRFHFLSRQARFRPYLALSGGAMHVDDIGFSFNADASSVGGPSDFRVFRGNFFDSSWVGTGAAVVGVEANLTCHWTLGVNGGVRYQTRLEGNDGDLVGRDFIGLVPVPLNKIRPANNDAGDRWTVPVSGYVKFRF